MHSILHGDCLAILPTLAANSIDAIVTDPPYCLSQSKNLPIYGGGKSSKRDKVRAGFMGKAWDDDVAFRPDVWRECLRVLKPGGHLACFGGSRTHHRVWVAVEDAGFEIRDTLMWLHGQGFPKSLDVSKAIDKHLGAEREIVGNKTRKAKFTQNHAGTGKGEGNINGGYNYGHGEIPQTAPASPEAQQWQGYGTALKPSHEPILLARKPLIGTVAQNVLTHGTGGINIDACRVAIGDDGPIGVWGSNQGIGSDTFGQITGNGYRTEQHPAGRWPPNLLHDSSPEVVECFPQTKTGDLKPYVQANVDGYSGHMPPVRYAHHKGDEGSAARFFPSLPFTNDERRILYCPKASRKDRAGSKHPTVKPIKLIEWLCRLITPPGGTILDPFAGSGTTGQAALSLGFEVILIEREDEYYNDILKRVSWPPLPADAP